MIEMKNVNERFQQGLQTQQSNLVPTSNINQLSDEEVC